MVEKIRQLCAQQGMTVQELQRRIGFTRNSIIRWDENRPSIDRVKAVADALGVSIDEIVDDSPPEA